MRILFDLMGTVLGALDHTLRPGVSRTIEELRVGGHRVAFWTSGRVEEMEAVLGAHKIEGKVYSKSTSVDFAPDLCVDDQPEDWMPGRVLKVDPYICSELACEPIDTARLFRGAAAERDQEAERGSKSRKDSQIESFLFGNSAGN